MDEGCDESCRAATGAFLADEFKTGPDNDFAASSRGFSNQRRDQK
jgi:hypothetical protein